jgi:hypothetical protein
MRRVRGQSSLSSLLLKYPLLYRRDSAAPPRYHACKAGTFISQKAPKRVGAKYREILKIRFIRILNKHCNRKASASLLEIVIIEGRISVTIFSVARLFFQEKIGDRLYC